MFVKVQFSGAPAVYEYQVVLGTIRPTVGSRVVVPTTLKKDSTVTLTIATVVETSIEDRPDLKPVLGVVDKDLLAKVTQDLLAEAAAKAAQ